MKKEIKNEESEIEEEKEKIKNRDYTIEIKKY